MPRPWAAENTNFRGSPRTSEIKINHVLRGKDYRAGEHSRFQERSESQNLFEKVSDEGNCHEWGAELLKGNFLLMEKGQPLCLACADLDQLVFLPAGNTATSRRARKHSSPAAVVRFSRARKRYERQGLMNRALWQASLTGSIIRF